MNLHMRNFKRGFSLVELAIVLGVMGTVIGSIWSYAGSARQTARVEQTVEAISATVTGVQSDYGKRADVVGSGAVLVKSLITDGVIPAQLISKMNAGFADSPLAQVANANGSFVVCAWNYDVSGAGDTYCKNGANSQFFAIELTNLDYGSCVAIATAVVPSRPAGLRDVWINGKGIVATGTGLPVAPTLAAHQNATFTTIGCNTGSSTNIVDFVYSLRPPVY